MPQQIKSITFTNISHEKFQQAFWDQGWQLMPIERAERLEALYRAMKEPWTLGYSPRVAEAMKRLEELG